MPGKTILLGQNWSLGMRPDAPRDQMPKGSAYHLSNLIPGFDAPLHHRNKWFYASPDLSLTSAVDIIQGGVASFPAGAFATPFVVVYGYDTGSATYKLFNLSGPSLIGSTPSLNGRTTFAWKNQVVFPPGDFGNDPKKYDGTTFASIGGTPPRTYAGWAFGDFVALAQGRTSPFATDSPGRIWYSGVGNIDSWTTSGTNASYLDLPDSINTGTAIGRQLQIVFGGKRIWAIRGSVPPPGGDFTVDPLFDLGGVTDFTIWRDWVVFSHDSGVYRTDGISLVDMTERGGVSSFWREGSPSGAVGVYGNYIFAPLFAGGGYQTFVCDIEHDVWFLFTNIYADKFLHIPSAAGTVEDLYWFPSSGTASGNLKRVRSLRNTLSASITSYQDDDGTNIIGSLETPFYSLGATEAKRLRRVYFSYADGPVNAWYKVVPHNESAVAYTGLGTFPGYVAPEGQWDLLRKPLSLNRRAMGIAFKLEGVAGHTPRFYTLEVEGHSLEESR